MSIELLLHTDGKDARKADLCTAGGWDLVTRWIARLPPLWKRLHELAETGETTETDGLAQEVTTAVRRVAPPPPVAKTLAHFLELLGEGSEHETAVVGMFDDLDDEDDDE